MSDHKETLCDWAELYVLDALSAEEREPYEKHLAICATCRSRVEEFARITEVLPLTSEAVEPPSGMKERILSRVLGSDAGLQNRQDGGESGQGLQPGPAETEVRAGGPAGSGSGSGSGADAAPGAERSSRESGAVPASAAAERERVMARQRAEAQARAEARSRGAAEAVTAEGPAGDAQRAKEAALAKQRAESQRRAEERARLAPPKPPASRRREGEPGHGWRWVSAGLAAALVGLGVYTAGLRGDVERLSGQLASENGPVQGLKVNEAVTLNPAAKDIVAQGLATIVIDDKGTHLVVQAEKLPELKGSEAFQVWLIKGDDKYSAGTFLPYDGKGAMYYTFEPKGYDTVAITLEPDAVGDQPRGKLVLAAPLKAGG
ncbi:anti-sigma factor [Paenibacillus aurantius]|uniref:Regulator of SigK n=1 Tax=Paenibacillus aurantius TaxID=2918900 RepID=A0AA96LES6_9BACL|nr:anti-sigma factor [Paenibacillus aurantius]WNQ12472.1 anti-sigma factor [Paenibacillus aurantius]